VPPRTTRLEVSYHFEHPKQGDLGASGGNVLDLGIFDPRGTDFLTDGFRGWSGSIRSMFYITPTSATPGYLPGPLTPGPWNIFLGIAELEDPACRYWLNVDLEVQTEGDEPEEVESLPIRPAVPGPQPVGGALPPEADSPLAGGESPGRQAKAKSLSKGGSSPPQAGWYRGDLHAHTVHSDGLNTISELAACARQRGLDFLAVTDHNTSSHHAEMALLGGVGPPASAKGGQTRPWRARAGGSASGGGRAGILLVPGEEVTTYRGHANVWGLREWLDFRCQDDDAIQRLIEYALGKGALFSINHPKSVGPPWEFPAVRAPCMEVWQAPWRWYNWESLDAWEGLLAEGERVVAVGGSDTHTVPPARPMHPHGPGEPTTWVYVEGPLSEEALLEAIGRGHVFISEDPGGPFLTLWADADGDGRFEHMMGDTLEAPVGSRVTVRVQYRGLAGKKVRVLRGRDVIEEVVADTEEVSRDLSLLVSEPGYLRAEVKGFRGRPERGEVVHAMTNPLYVRLRSC
jgi:hypothetical protein